MTRRIGARDVADVLLGACLAVQPYVLGMPLATKISANACLVGVFLVEATLLGVVLGECRSVRWAKTALGGWLVASPFLLGFSDLRPAVVAWIVGVLVLASADTARSALDLAVPIQSVHLRYRALTLTPERLVKLGAPAEPMAPERIARRIVDSSDQIRRTLLGPASEAEVDMCVLGYRALSEDAILLADLVRRESKRRGPLRRLWLRAAQHRATDSLSRAREYFPREVFSVPREKK